MIRYFDFDLLNKMNIISQSEVQLTEDELASFCKDAMKSRSEFCVRKVQLMAEQNGFRLNVPSEAMNVYNHGSIERMQNEMKKLEKYM